MGGIRLGTSVVLSPESRFLARQGGDAVAAAQKEAHEKITARREKTRAAAAAAMQKVDQNIKSIGDAASKQWGTLKAKVAVDMDILKAKVAERSVQ